MYCSWPEFNDLLTVWAPVWNKSFAEQEANAKYLSTGTIRSYFGFYHAWLIGVNKKRVTVLKVTGGYWVCQRYPWRSGDVASNSSYVTILDNLPMFFTFSVSDIVELKKCLCNELYRPIECRPLSVMLTINIFSAALQCPVAWTHFLVGQWEVYWLPDVAVVLRRQILIGGEK